MRKRIIKSIVIFLLILGMIVQYMPQDVSTAYAGETMYGIEIAASEITGINDLAVYASQKWLNTTYGKKSGYKKTTQDGTVGPGTMEAFITALQIEIGAKDVDGGFGPETAKLIPVLKKGCESEKGITKNLIRILQYGLYCKGYGTNQEVEGKFGDGTKKAIERLQDDIGIKVTGEVNAILFKAILNTDGYVLDKKNGDENFRKMQRLVNKYYNKKLGIIAANGKYDRDTSKGMICALQEAVGANVDSSFGSDTMSKCPEKVDTSYPNDSSDKGIIHIIQYMLYANGYNRKAQFDGVYSSYIKEQVEKFQRFMCLPISSCNYSYGITTRSTMASLMVSCGDTSRSGNACDMIHKLTDDEARELAIDGYKYVGRYILNAPGGILDKETSINEIRNILSKKMAFIPIFQMNAREIKDYSAKAGNIHAINATAAAMSLQIPYNSTIYFAVDFDAQGDTITNEVMSYFRALSGRMKSLGKYKVGIYGTRNVCTQVCNAGYATTCYVSNMSYGYSGNMGFKMPDKWAFDQFDEIKDKESKYGFGIDKVTASGRDKGVKYLQFHNTKRDWKPVVNEASSISMYWADPIDLSTGAFCIDYDAMKIMGAQEIELALSYSSEGLAEGTLGAGWYHTYEKKIEKTEDGLKVYTTPSSYLDFILAEGKENTYICTSIGRLNDVITIEDNGNYYLNCNNNMEYWFDSKGKLVTEKSSNGFYTDIEYGDNFVKIIDRTSKAYILLQKDSSGKIVNITDKSGKKCTVEYDSKGYIATLIDVNGNKTSYKYDEVGKITSGTDNDGTCYVKNEYDKLGRVVKQYDAEDRKGTTIIEYDDSETDGVKKVSVTDRNGYKKKYVYTKEGYILSETDQNGNTTTYSYDEYGNQTVIKDALGNSENKAYSNYRLESETDKLGAKTTYEYNEKGKPTKITYSNGKSVVNEYDKDNRVVKTTDLRGKVIIYNYNKDGTLDSINDGGHETKYTYENSRIKTETDARGNVKKYEYNDNGELIATIDANGIKVSQKLNPKGKIIETIDAQNVRTKNTYTCRDTIKTTTDGKGNVYTYVYDGNGNNVAIINPDGTKTTFEYDSEDRLMKTTDTKGNTKICQYDAVGRVISETDSNNGKTTYVYDAVGNILKKTDAEGGVITYTYNANGDKITETDAEGNVTKYEYNSNSKLEKTIDPKGGEITIKYNDAFDIIEEVNALGKSTKYEYDKYGNMTKKILPNGSCTIYEYDECNNLVKETNSLKETTSYKYDKCNRLVEVIDANGNSTKTEYDTNGREISIIDANGHKISYEYDANGNKTKTIDGKGNVISQNEYDMMNNAILQTDALGNKTSFTYDANKNITAKNSADGNIVNYKYNALNKITEVKDALNNSSTISYDKLGRTKNIVGPLGSTISYDYNKNGKLISETTTTGGKILYKYNSLSLVEELENARGEKTSYKYDEAGRIIESTSKDGTTKYTYDDNGNIVVVENEIGKITRTFDQLDRVTSYTDVKGKTIKYAYDAVGNMKEITYPDNTTVKYEYDKVNNLIKVIDWNNRTTTYEYDENNRLIKTTNADKSISTRTYDKAGQLISIEEKDKDDKVINKYEYEYNNVGNVITEKSVAENIQYSMTYDKLNRVISRVKTDLATNEKTEENYTYDAAGNITKYKSEEAETNMSYGSNNELKGSDSCTLTYDLDGNMIETSIETIDKLHFNVDNKLTQAGKNEYTYDAEGSRVSQKDDNGTVRYTYDVQNSQLLMEYDKDGNMTKYVYGNGLVSQENKDGYRNFHYDLRGSTTALTDENGNITSRYNYSTYGQVTTENEETNFLYNGRDGVIKDSNGLLYMRARYYMPNMMRFTSADKVHGTVMEPATLNRYAYVEGNPVTKVDPSGYSSQPGSVGSILRTVGYKNRVLTAEFAKGMGNSGFIFNMDRRPILGVQFPTAHRICDVGGLIPIIGFGFDIGNVILYDLEGYKIKSVAAMAGAGLNLFGSGLFAKGSMSSLDNFAEAGVKYSDDVIEAGVKSGIGYSKTIKNVEAPILPEGSPWERNVLNSFAGGKSNSVTYEGGTTLYRVGGKNGGFWSLDPPPATEYQWRVDTAIKQEFCNNASTLYTMTIPKGATLSGLEGKVGSQGMGLYGGAHQVYIDYKAVPSDWIEITPMQWK